MKLNQAIELRCKVKIFWDARNWVLQIGSVNNRFFYCELDDLFEDLLNSRLKSECVGIKNIELVVNAVQDARAQVSNDIEVLKKVMTKRNRDASSKELVKKDTLPNDS